MDSQKNRGEPDVILKISDTKFPCHRELLSTNSPYFHAMFSHNFAEKNKEEIEIKDLEPETMDMLLRSIQLGKDVLEGLLCEQVLSLLQASSMLQFESLQKYCVDALTQRWLTPDTCLQIMAQADALDLSQLYTKARVMALWNFSSIKNNPQFLKLSIDDLEDYLNDDGLNATGGELEVFEACFSWIQNIDSLEREKSTWRAFRCVRFSDVSRSNMRTILLCVSQLEDEEVHELFEYILKLIPETENCSCSKLTEEDEQSGEGSPIVDKKSTVTSRFCCSPTAPVDEPSSLTSKLIESTDVRAEIADKARLFMASPPRALPLVPCVIGRCFHPPKPYLIGFKENRLVPLVRLEKAEQSHAVEPNGYRVVMKGQDLFILGGEFLWGHSNWNTSVWRYNQWSESWTFETSLANQCRHQSVCCLDDDIYVMGGFGKYRVIADFVNRYNTITKKWTLCPPLPCPIYSAASCAFKGCVYVFGPQVWSYSPQRHNWLTLVSCANFAFNSALPYGDCIYLAGTYSRELYKFDGNKVDITKVGSFQLNATNICLVRDTIFMFGVDHDMQHHVETYNIKTNSFEVVHWQPNDDDAVTWSESYSIGCFPVIDY